MTGVQTCALPIYHGDAVRRITNVPGAALPPLLRWLILTDDWTRRWPDYSGVVWYRIQLHKDCSAASQEPAALLVSSINMAGEVYLNDTLLWRDASLQDPLTRSWNTPRYWILPDAALHATDNAIWIRIQGRALVHSGLGIVRQDHRLPALDGPTRGAWKLLGAVYLGHGERTGLCPGRLEQTAGEQQQTEQQPADMAAPGRYSSRPRRGSSLMALVREDTFKFR